MSKAAWAGRRKRFPGAPVQRVLRSGLAFVALSAVCFLTMERKMNTRSSRTRILGLAAVCILLIVPGLAAQSTQSAQPTFRILVPKSSSSIPLLVLEEQDALEDRFPRFTLQVDFFTAHPQALAVLLRGDAELLFTGTSQGLQNHLDGGPLVLVNTGVWGVSSMISADESINSVADLRGKTIAVPFPGAPLDVQLRYILEAAGMDPEDDVEMRYSVFPQTIAEMGAGRVDAAPLPEPIATQLVLGRGYQRVFEMRKAWGAARGGEPFAPEVSLFATKRFAADVRSAILSLVREWRRASTWVSENIDEAAAFAAPLLDRPEAVLHEAIARTVYRVPYFAENREAVTEYFGIIREKVPTMGDGPAGDFFFSP